MYHDDSLALNVIVALTAIMVVVWLANDDCQPNTYPEPPTSGEIVIPETTAPETAVDQTSTPDPASGKSVEPVGLEAVSEAPSEPTTALVDETTSCPTPLYTEHLLLRAAVRRVQERRASNVTYVEAMMGKGEDPSFHVVFTNGQTRYSVNYWSPRKKWKGDPRTSLTFWEGPDGTTDQASLLTYSDIGVEGCVNFGFGHEQADFLQWNHAPYHSNEGVEHHALWQERYDRAAHAFIRAAGVRGP